jgi:hypothetical protein
MKRNLNDVVFIALFALTVGISISYWIFDAYKLYNESVAKAKNLSEPDPFQITATSIDTQHIGCGGTLWLHRHIVADKPLVVTVQRRFRSFSDAHYDSVYHLADVTYREDKPVNKKVAYQVVTPKHIPDGFYLYEPILTYQVNEHLTITKPAPSQTFYLTKEAHCYETK